MAAPTLALAQNDKLMNALKFYHENITPSPVLTKQHKMASKTEALHCSSWLLKLDDLNKATPILRDEYLRNLLAGVAMDNNIDLKLLIKEAPNVKPLLESCSKAGIQIWKLEMFESFIKSKNKETIPDRIASCFKSLAIFDSIAFQINDQTILKAAHGVGERIGTRYGSSTIAINEKFNPKSKVDIQLSVSSVEKYKPEDLESPWFKELQRGCLVFSTGTRQEMRAGLEAKLSPLQFQQANYEFKKGNKSEAIRLYKSACSKNLGKACSILGNLEEKNGNSIEAMRLYEKSCDLNDDLGCLSLADTHAQNKEFKKSLEAGKKACDLNVLDGCHLAGIVAEKMGLRSESMVLFKNACDKNHMKSCVNLGLIESDGGVLTALKKACDANYPAGCLMLGFSKNKSGNKADALLLFKKACEHSLPQDEEDFSKEMRSDACHFYAVREKEKGNQKLANEIFNKNCQAGDSKSCDALKVKSIN